MAIKELIENSKEKKKRKAPLKKKKQKYRQDKKAHKNSEREIRRKRREYKKESRKEKVAKVGRALDITASILFIVFLLTLIFLSIYFSSNFLFPKNNLNEETETIKETIIETTEEVIIEDPTNETIETTKKTTKKASETTAKQETKEATKKKKQPRKTTKATETTKETTSEAIKDFGAPIVNVNILSSKNDSSKVDETLIFAFLLNPEQLYSIRNMTLEVSFGNIELTQNRKFFLKYYIPGVTKDRRKTILGTEIVLEKGETLGNRSLYFNIENDLLINPEEKVFIYLYGDLRDLKGKKVTLSLKDDFLNKGHGETKEVITKSLVNGITTTVK
jgi:hypothetical protein